MDAQKSVQLSLQACPEIHPMQRFVNEKLAATVLGLSVSTMQKYRHRSIGPKYHKFGEAVRYAIDDLMAFAAKHVVQTHGRVGA